MRKKINFLYTVFIVLFLLCGCWDSKDINEKEITTTVIVDKIDEEYSLIVELANLSSKQGEEGSGSDEKYSTVDSYGETLASCRRNLDNKLKKMFFLGTVRIVIFTENFAKEGVEEYCYRMRSLNAYRKTLNIITIADDPKELLEVNSSGDCSTGHAIEKMLNQLKETGRALESSLSAILEKLASKNKCFLLPHIGINEEVLELKGYSVIHAKKLKTIIPIEEAKGIHYLINKDVKYFYVVPFDNNIATVEVTMKKRKSTPKYDNNDISFNIEFKFDAIVKYLDINDGLDDASIAQVEKNVKDLISKDIQLALDTSLEELKCDYLNLSEVFRIKFPNEYKKMDWCQEYKNSNIDFTVELDVEAGGNYDYNPDIKWKEGSND